MLSEIVEEFVEEVLDFVLPQMPAKTPRHADPGKATWTRYKAAKPVHCDDCVMEVHEHWPNGTHAPNHAAWRRKVGDKITFHCFDHARPQREADAERAAKNRKPGTRKAAREL